MIKMILYLTVMITKAILHSVVLSFPHTEVVAHFDRDGFKVIGRRMFASYLERDNTANVFLTPKEQKLFCKMDKTNIFPVPNKWGEKGATTFVLNSVSRETLMEALQSAYNDVINSGKK
jgi:hypothetical protein